MTTADRIAVMDEGVIQQIGTPMDLFDNPVNRFVANFVGTINLLRGRVSSDAEGHAIFDSPVLGRIALPSVTLLSGEADMAVRPHSLALAATPEDSRHLWLEGTVAEREFLGEFVRYVVNVQDVGLIVDQTHHVGQPVFEPGARVHVGVDTTQVRLLPL